MDYIEKIFDFVDGTLDTTSEQFLFDELAKNAELRTELKQQMALSDAIRKDFVAYNPTADSTMKIFTQLGFTTTATTLSTVTSSALKTKVLGFIAPYSQGLITFLATSVLATVAFVLWKNDGDLTILQSSKHNGVSKYYNNQTPPPQLSNNQNSTVPITSQSLTKNIVDTTIKREIIYREKIIYRTDQKVVETAVNTTKNAYNKEIVKLKEEILQLKQQKSEQSDILVTDNEDVNNKFILALNKLQNTYLSQSSPIIQEKIIVQKEVSPNFINVNTPQFGSYVTALNNFSSGTDLGLSIETGWAQYFSNYNEVVNPGEGYQNFNNLHLAALLDVGKEISLGVDYRRENFYLVFNKINEQGQSYRAESKPNFETFSAIVRYKPASFVTYGFSPFVQAGIGGNVGGEVGRFTLGTEYLVSNSYSFIIGGDYNVLNFKDDRGLKYSSSKLGLQIGFGLKF